MKESAYFVITARGGIVDEGALVDALKSGGIAAAGIDVFAVEPPPLDDPLVELGNVILTPHTAGVTVDARKNCARRGRAMDRTRRRTPSGTDRQSRRVAKILRAVSGTCRQANAAIRPANIRALIETSIVDRSAATAYCTRTGWDAARFSYT